MSSLDPSRRSQKRPRPVISCLECRRKKLKCDRLLPCRQCTKSGREPLCEYAPGQEPDVRGKDSGVGESPGLRPVSSGRAGEIDDLQERVKTLERALQQRNQQDHQQQHSPHHVSRLSLSPSNNTIRLTNSARDIVQFQPDSTLSYFAAPDAFLTYIETAIDNEEFCALAQDLLDIYESLPPKPSWPSENTLDLESLVLAMRHKLPESSLVNELVGVYFDYFEHCTRVLHKPTFMAQLQRFRHDQLSGFEQESFLVMLLATISTASSLHINDNHALPNLHSDREDHGVYQLIQQWLKLRQRRDQGTFQYLQIQLLLLKPHKSRPTDARRQWEDVNSAVQTALLLGLHDEMRYPADIFESEIWHRLWATTIEYDLFYSVACNMPLRVQTNYVHFPLSLDDVDLFVGMQTLPKCKNTIRWTDTICQYVLSASYSARAAAYAAVSNGSVLDYDSLLNWTRQIEWKINDAPQLFRLDDTTDEGAGSPPRVMAQMEFDFLLLRPLKAVYSPYARVMPADDRFEEARIHWVQSTLMSLNFQDLFDPKYPTLDLPRAQGLWEHFYTTYKWDVDLAAFATCLELQRLRTLHPSGSDVTTPPFQNSGPRSANQIAGWSIAGLVKAMEETIEPLVRRSDSSRDLLRDVVFWTLITASLKVNPTCSRESSMKNELQSLNDILKQRSKHRSTKKTGLTVDGSTNNPRDASSALKWLGVFVREDVPSETGNQRSRTRDLQTLLSRGSSSVK